VSHQPKVCRSCGAAILWAQVLEDDRKTVKMKPRRCNLATLEAQVMPVDWQPNPDGRVICMDRDGAIVAFVLKAAEAPPEGARPRTAHHQTCPDAQKWKRNQGRRGRR